MSGSGGEHQWTPATGTAGGEDGRSGAARGPRWIISLRAVIVLLAMAVAIAGVLWIEQAGVSNASEQLLSQDPARLTVPPLPGASSTVAPTAVGGGSDASIAAPAKSSQATGPPSTARGTAVGTVLVHVVGAVKRPGVVSLPAGSRIFQALDAAGGALPSAEMSMVNLAALAGDGTQIVVPTKAQAAAGASGPGAAVTSGEGAAVGAPGSGDTARAAAGPGAAVLNINTATVEDLDGLPGVGPVLAGRIVAWRTDHGPFSSVDELDGVSGIGAKMLATLRPLVTVQ
ncbi:MAG: ComEA family DNA-binding protein [Specibacter sp.]